MEWRNFICSLCYLMVFSCTAEATCPNFDTITNNLREVVIGKCELYQQAVNPDVCTNEGFRNCTDIWDAFSRGFIQMPRCDGPVEAYDDYINLTDHTVPRDTFPVSPESCDPYVEASPVTPKYQQQLDLGEVFRDNRMQLDYNSISDPTSITDSLFWENVYPFVGRYSNNGQKRYTISDTLTGYIGDGLSWCSDPDTPDGLAPPGTQCPGFEATPECPQHALYRFWAAASKRFAEKASGEVFIMLNASSEPIFANTTFFSESELPYLRTGVVTKTTVLLLNEWPDNRWFRRGSKCCDPSLELLANQLQAKGIAYDCVENPRDVTDLLCLQDSSLGMCRMKRRRNNF